jgi:hypothetical protein
MRTVTKIKELIAKLQECDPDGTVLISLDGALLYEDEELGEVEYSFPPVVDCLFSTHAERSDSVYFCLTQEDTERIVGSRRDGNDSEAKTISLPAHPGIVMSAPVAVAVPLNHETYMSLLALVDSCNRADQSRDGATTHGKLDIPKLFAMLAEDAAMTVTRPGCWEAANFQQVLDSHGYQ